MYVVHLFRFQRSVRRDRAFVIGRGLPRISRALVIYASGGAPSTVFGKKFRKILSPLFSLLLYISRETVSSSLAQMALHPCTKKSPAGGDKRKKPGGALFSRPFRGRLSSPLRCLTAVFGMGTGVTTAPSPPDFFPRPLGPQCSLNTGCCTTCPSLRNRSFRTAFLLQIGEIKTLGLLVPVSGTRRRACRSGLSTP